MAIGTKDKLGKPVIKLIERALKKGESVTMVSKNLGVSERSVRNVSDRMGHDSYAVSKARANLASVQFNRARRIETLNKFFAKAEELLEQCEDAESFKHITYALSLLIDKRRLEEGSATSRVEMGVWDLSKLNDEKLALFEKIGQEAVALGAPADMTDGQKVMTTLPSGVELWTKPTITNSESNEESSSTTTTKSP